MDIKILENLFQVTIERRNLCNRQDQIIHKRIMVDLGLLKWKTGVAEPDRSGKPEGIAWDALQRVDPHREESLLGRNAHSARYGELIHDRTGKLVSVHQQEQAYFDNFIMGSDAAEFDLWTKTKTKCEKDRKECRALQSHVTNIQKYGECSWLRH